MRRAALEIYPNVHRIEIPLANRLLAQHLLVGERVYLVDTGVADTPEEHILPYLQGLGRDPREISGVLNTHPDADHIGGNSVVRRSSPHALVMAHAEDASLVAAPERCLNERYDFEVPYGAPIPSATRSRLLRSIGEATPVDIRLLGGERLRLAEDRWVQVEHCPGHSLGHLIVHDPAHRAATITDAVLGAYIPTTDDRPAFAPTYRFKRAYLETIRFIRHLELDLLLTSHFPVMEGSEAVEGFLRESAQFVYRLDLLIEEELARAKAPLTLSEIIDGVKDRVVDWASPDDPFVGYSLCYPVAAALDEGVEAGIFAMSITDGVNHYALQ